MGMGALVNQRNVKVRDAISVIALRADLRKDKASGTVAGSTG